MTTISENQANDHEIGRTILAFFKKYRIGGLLRKANASKSKGIPVVNVFMYLIQLVFTKKSMYMNILNGTHTAGFGKDVVYRFLNSTFINWSKFLLLLASAVIANYGADQREQDERACC